MGRTEEHEAVGASGAQLVRRAQRDTQRIALRHKARGRWQSWTWAAVAEEVAKQARGWAGEGVAGQRALVLGAHRPRALFAALGVQAAGGTAVFVDPGIAGAELTRLLRETSLRFAFAPGEEEVDRLPGVERIAYDDPRGLSFRQDPRLVDAASFGADAGPASSFPPGEFEVLSSGALARVKPIENAAGASLSRLRADDEALLLEPLATAGALRFVLQRWLDDGFCLSLPETADSVDADLRERAPTYLAASAAFYQRLWSRTQERLGGPKSWRRRVIDAAINAQDDSLGTRPSALGDRLVLRPLTRALGLGRVRQTVVTEGPLDSIAHGFLRALALDPRDLLDLDLPTPLAIPEAPRAEPLEAISA